MKQKLLQCLMLIAALLTSTHAHADHDFEAKNSDGVTIYYNIISSADKTCEVTFQGSSYDSYSNEYTGSIVIPETVTYNGTTYSVTGIYHYAFDGCTGLTSITIPNSVTSIGIYAFYGCSGLTSVTIGNSVTGIYHYAFDGCIGLTSVNISDLEAWCKIDFGDYHANPLFFAKNLYLNGELLTELVIPDSIKEIKYSAFYSCTSLTSVTIGNSVSSIGNYAFDGCIGLTSVNISDLEAWCKIDFGDYHANPLFFAKNLYLNGELLTELVIPDSIKEIKNSAFSGCSGLASVTIGNSVTNIGDFAFSGCTSLTSITIPNSVSSIGDSAFYGCSGLTSITIPNSVSSIGNYAFRGCSGLTSITIPNSVTSIGDSAFRGCSGLASVTIPNSVSSIGDSAFSGCSSLTNVIIPNSVTSIGDYAFDGCSGLKELRIEDGESTLSLGYNSYSYSSSYIGEGLFYDCPLETLYLGRNLSYSSTKRYGYSPFYNQDKLKSVTIGNSVTSIGDSAFGGCSDLTSVIFNAENCEIMGTSGSPVFKDCNKLSSVTIGENVKSIPDYAFSGCSGLTSVIFNAENCKTMGSSSTPVFNGCAKLSSVTIGEKVTNIPDYAFYGCSGLTNVTIPNSVTSIGSSAFSGCSGLTSVTIPNSVTSIGSSAFRDCSGLTSLTIPNSVASIGNYAFNRCTSLKELRIEDGKSTLSLGYNSYDRRGKGLFYDCPLEMLYLGRNLSYSSTKDYGYSPFYNQTELKSVTIGTSVTSIGYYAFFGCSSLTSVTIPNSVASIGSDALFGCTGLCSIKMNATATTQTKLNFDITNNTEYEFYIEIKDKTYISKDKTMEISELGPGSRPSEYGLIINDIFCKISSGSEFYTKSLNQNIQIETGIISINAKGSYTEGDATILGTGLGIGSAVSEYDNQNEKIFNNLDPNKSYTVYYSVNTKEGGVYSASKTFTTGALTWSDEEYQATSTTSARLVTATNCDATEGTGFEWRRYGAPENLKPNAVACPVIDGMLIGSLRNLNSEVYYEFRPYYTSSSGNKYYGEWTALFTGDANVYFEPEVRTYEDVKVVTNKATLKGYALAGTDDIISQGFEYWESSVQPGTANSLNASVNSKKVEVSGISMTAIVSDLKYGTTYCYRAFATTASGTIYGETVEFTTEKDLSGIENVIVEDDETVEYYNLQGVKIVNPSSGLYIKRQGNKVTKVIL